MKHLTYRIALILLMVTGMGCVSAYAQQVRGTVTDEAGEPVIGAGVLVQGTTVGTTTDVDGTYILDRVPANAVLVVSSIGYETQSEAVNGRSVINFVLREDALLLDDVVVVGYGVQKKSVVTASISKVDGDQLNTVKASTINDALKGKVSGVQITQASGQPGSGSQIKIRGIGTVNNSDPLYIVDGMPVDGGIDYLNPTDIQSVEILKDAASAAIYGARAANGVVLVTTKSGSKGKATITYNGSYGWQNPWRKKEVLNAKEYMTIMNE
ncbi:MAG: TonB-dependent receptor plug domain-containing protein, partial [Bacteroidales bacterium]|nr:TonB-dependent receptor plug domain-containing protein [Bacteroidales bacterium]